MIPPLKWSHLPIIILAGLLIGGVFSYAVVLISQKTSGRHGRPAHTTPSETKPAVGIVDEWSSAAVSTACMGHAGRQFQPESGRA